MDRGFFSDGNLADLVDSGYDFIVPASFSNKRVKSMVLEMKKDIERGKISLGPPIPTINELRILSLQGFQNFLYQLFVPLMEVLRYLLHFYSENGTLAINYWIYDINLHRGMSS